MTIAHDIPDIDARGLREFGITTGAIVAVLFGLLLPYLFGAQWPVWPWIVFAVLAIWGLVAPATLRSVYRGSMRFGLFMGRIMTPVIMTLLFIVTMVPTALILRVLGKDPMRRRFDGSNSYREDSRQPSVKNLEKPY